jgi:hypothetical protein
LQSENKFKRFLAAANISKGSIGKRGWRVPAGVVEKMACRASGESATPSFARADSKRRRNVLRPFLIGLLLIMSSSEGLAIEKVEASVENDGESSAARERIKLYTWRKRASVVT